MAYTFGAANTDDVTIGSHLNSNSGGIIIMGWWKPTTLTAGRFYWGASSLISILVHTTTSELSVRIDRATTDAIWNSSGAGIVVDQWQFICLARSSTGGTQDMRLWVGHNTDPPLEIPITVATAGAGSETAGSASVIANASAAGTGSFQGQIEQVMDMRFANSLVSPLSLETAAVITQAEADYFYQTCVMPYWNGDPQPTWVRGTTTACYLFDLGTINPQLDIYQRGPTQRLTPLALTVSGATISAERAPHPLLNAWPTQLQFLRRR